MTPWSDGRRTEVATRLAAAGCVAAAEEAAELISAAPDQATLESFLRRREEGEPIAWITGKVRFCGHDVHVGRGVYVPRSQSEELARRASTLWRQSNGWAADLCTGSGAVAAHLLSQCSKAPLVATDISPRAVASARRNGIPAFLGDLAEALRPQAFSVVTAVAPYVPTRQIGFLPADVQRYEPRLALDGGDDGLVVLRRVVKSAARVLRPGGWLLVELGGDEDAALGASLEKGGFCGFETWRDEDGDLRGLAARLGG